MLERMLRIAGTDPEHAGARRKRQNENEERTTKERVHRAPAPIPEGGARTALVRPREYAEASKAYDTRARAWSDSRYSGPDDASIPVATSQPLGDVQPTA